MPTLCFAICTAQRPQLLSRCLSSIAGESIPTGWKILTVVVENGAGDYAEKMVTQFNAQHGDTYYYELEPRLGIPIARNRSVVMSLKLGADWIAFIDDDEVLVPGWLAAMTRHAESDRADVYHGPMRRVLPTTAPDWLDQESGSSKHPPGTELKSAATNNTLATKKIFTSNALGLRFDETMRFTGGSDTDLFTRANSLGIRIIHVDDGVVEETVPASRLTLKWQLQRTFRVGANSVLINKRNLGFGTTLWRTGTKTLGRMLAALFVHLPMTMGSLISPPRFRRNGYKSLKNLASCLGMVSGLFGIQSQPYRKLEGE